MEKKKLIPRVVISLPVSPGDRSRRSGTAGNHLKDKKNGMKKQKQKQKNTHRVEEKIETKNSQRNLLHVSASTCWLLIPPPPPKKK